MIVNFTNHPSEVWGEKQTYEARKFGEIIDIPFPEVDPYADENMIEKLSEEYLQKIMALKPSHVLCQGEFTLVYSIVNKLRDKNIPVVAACSRRNVVYSGAEKKVKFEFVQFREYGD